MLDIFNRFTPEIIISPNFATTHHMMFYLYGKKRGVKMMTLVDSKIAGNYIFSYDFNYSTGLFFEHLEKLNQGIINSDNIVKAKDYIRQFRENFKKQDTFGYYYENSNKRNWKQYIRHRIEPYLGIIRWFVKPEQKKNKLSSIGPTIDYRPPKIILRDHYCRERYKKFMDKFHYYSLDKIDKYAYFPLQVQPEEAIDIYAPYFSNQIEAIRLAAMSLPDDYTLVVKEHPAMVGYRSPSYIEKIDKTPNVKLIDYRISSQEVLTKADLVISPSGTTLAEAAFLKKPAIQLGNLGTTLQLPNVFKHTDMTTLSDKIKEVLKYDFENDEYERRLMNFVAAAYDTGYDLNYIKIWEKGDKEGRNKLWEVYKKEISRILIKN